MQIYKNSPTAETLPTIINHKGIRAVGARDLYHQLGLHSSQFARWAKKNITNNPFAQKDQDWFDGMSNGKLDYVLSLDFVKRLAIIVRAQRGEEIRAYFVQSDKMDQVASRPRPSSMVNTDSRLVLVTDANELLLLTYLASKMNKDRVCWPGNKTICTALKWGSIDRLQATKKRLVEKGLLEVKERFRENSPAQTSNYYKILTPLISNYTPATPTLKSGRGDTLNPGMAPTLKSGNEEVLISEVLTTESNTPYSPPAGDIRLTEDDFLKKEKNTVSEAAGGPGPVEDLQCRMERFKEHVLAIGGATYTLQMLNAFINYYSQSNNAKKPKMKWEILVRKGWEIGTQLEAWADRNYSRIPCYLTHEQKTIAEKRQAFAKSLEPYMRQYGRELLLEFYRHWSVPENVQDPQYLRWEKEPYWDLGTCLADWFDRKRTLKPWATRNTFPAKW